MQAGVIMMRGVVSSSAMLTKTTTPRRASIIALSRGLSSYAMLEGYPGVPETSPEIPHPPVFKVSTISNGAKVATCESGKLASAVAIVVNSGSRDESSAQAGASLFLKGMAFRSTYDRTSLKLHRNVELVGGSIAVTGGRETTTYMADCPAGAEDVVLRSIASSVLIPKIVHYEMEDAKKMINSVELRLHSESSESQVIDALHAAAYNDTAALGNPYYQPCQLSPEGLSDFHSARYKAPAMTVFGASLPHNELKAVSEAILSGADASAVADRPASKYVGGEVRIRAKTPTTSVSIALPATAASDVSAPVYEVLATILDRRAKSSTPAGKGFITMYSDGGLVGVTGTVDSSNAAGLTQSLVACLKDLTHFSRDEVKAAVSAAKIERQLKLECPMQALQAMTDGTLQHAELDGVTPEAVQVAATKALKSELSVASVGNITDVMMKSDIQAML